MRKVLLLHLALVVCICSRAQPSGTKLKIKVDSLVKAEMNKQRIPGCSLAVVRNGMIDYVKGYGFANLEHRVTVKPETIFQSGSVGKRRQIFLHLKSGPKW